MSSESAKYEEDRRLIQQAMREKQLVLFVGAGASVAAGMPLWDDAVAQIADKISEDPKKISSLVIPQYYFNARGKKEYTQLMRDIFKYKEPLETTEVHRLIMAFDVDTIITTNYDHLLEQAAEERGIFLQVIAKDSDLPYRKAGRELIKMHGDFEHDNFVLKEDDYLHYHRNFKLIETYIKSLIGTKTVLFIGYSLSDPDVKQIISWVKEILDEEFQHAYMIKTNGQFGENENEYYKHLGVNIIYASELLNEKIKDEGSALNRTLQYLLQEDRCNGSVIDQIHEDLRPFNQMNYTLQRYITSAIYGNNTPTRTLYIDNFILSCNRSNPEVEDIALLNELVKAIKDEKTDKKIKDIFNSIKRSSLVGVIYRDGEEEIREQFPNLPTSEYEIAMESFDYKKLNEIRERNASRLSEDNPELYFQQAMICSYLRDYHAAYFCLYNAAKICYRKKLFAWYFIAQFNKVIIAKILDQLELWNDRELTNQINKEVEEIDLNKTLQSIPDLGNNHNKFLRDLIEFRFSSSIMYEAYRTSRTVQKESRQTFIVHPAPPAYDVLRNLVYDYYQYCSKNYIQVDRYSENTEIYNLFARSLLTSLAAPTIEKESALSFGVTSNLHVERLSKFDLYLLLRYVENSYLKELIREYKIKHIELEEDAKDYVEVLARTIPLLDRQTRHSGTWLFDKYLMLLSYTEIAKDTVINVLDKLLGCSNVNALWDLRASTALFVQAIYRQKLYNDADMQERIKATVTRYLDLFISSEYGMQNVWGPIVSLLNCLYAAGKPYSDVETIKRLIEDGENQFAIEISSDCSKSVKKYVKQYYNDGANEALRRNPYLYAYLVLNDYVELNAETENEAYKMIREELADQKEKKMITFPANTLFLLFMNMYLSERIVDKDAFLNIVIESGDEYIKWMTNPSTFDYTYFNIEWLTRCRKVMLEELADNKEISEKIRKAFSEQYMAGKDVAHTEEIIMQYFM